MVSSSPNAAHLTEQQQRALAARARRVYDTLCARSASFGAAIWHCGPAGQVIVAPTGSESLPQEVVDHVARIAADPTAPLEGNGFRFFRIEDRVGSQCVA